MMIMHHWVFFVDVSILVCAFLLLFSSFAMHSLRIGSLNINGGGRDRGKRAMLELFIKQNKLDIILLQETHTVAGDDTEWQKWWGGSCFLSHGTSNSRGVSILISPTVRMTVLSHDQPVAGRMQAVKLRIEELNFTILNIYAPNAGGERESFFEVIKLELEKCKEDQLILGGDWNCTLEPSRDRTGIEPNIRSSKLLKSITRHYSLVDVWRTKHPTQKEYTWVKTGDGFLRGARLDRFYVSNSVRPCLAESDIIPAVFSDHHLIQFRLLFTKTHNNSSFWHFNNKLLQDRVFCESFRFFWAQWGLKRQNFESLIQWWDVGKTQIRVFCQQYSSHSTKRLKDTVQALQDCIRSIELSLEADSNNHAAGLLREKRRELSHMLKQRAEGALVRSRYQDIKDMDAPTAFFFGLEKTKKQSGTMTCLTLPDGRLTSDPEEMRQTALDYYSELFTVDYCCPDTAAELLKNLPRLSAAERVTIDSTVLLEEFTEALRGMASGRAPGLDGLTVEFYKHFWDILGADLHQMALSCFSLGKLPTSCRRAVLSLLPKKGDLSLLKNWRPLALLCTDYKLISKVLANRLKGCLDSIIHRDQSYCVPGRSILDNLFLLRDLFDLGSGGDVHLGIVSLDQEKAFDRVDHNYLFSVLKAFGFGKNFISSVKIMYNSVECLLKVGGGLSRPVSVSRGIRQGCPLSGLLYSLAIEPLLSRLRTRMTGISLPRVFVSEPLITSAYADDLTVFVSHQDDVNNLVESLNCFAKASSAKVNWNKSEACLVGEWEGRTPPTLPGSLNWTSCGLKILGLYFGPGEFQAQNWVGLLDKVRARLSSWKWLLPQLSFRGRALVANNLVASMLWHKLLVLCPPTNLLNDIQRSILDFFWNGKHWIRAPALYLPVHEGGQGLIDIMSRVMAFRLHTGQRLLHHYGARWLDTAYTLLRRAGRLGYDKQLFLLNKGTPDLMGLSPYYGSVLNAWQAFKMKRENMLTPGPWTLQEPLFYNGAISTDLLDSLSVRAALQEAGCVKLGHLAASLETLEQKVRLRPRLLSRVVQAVMCSIPTEWRAFISEHINSWDPTSSYRSPPVTISHNADDWIEDPNKLLDLSQSKGVNFETLHRKAAYTLCIKIRHFKSLTELEASRWAGLFGSSTTPRGRWKSLYRFPVEKRAADLQWRIVHGCVATNRYKARFDPTQSERCDFCDQTETLTHLFAQCNRLASLFSILTAWCLGLGEVFSLPLFVYGPVFTNAKRKRNQLLNFLFATAKIAIWLTRRNQANSEGCADVQQMFYALLRSRLRVEYAYFRVTERLKEFSQTWAVEKVLCHVTADGELLFSF
uniref:Reverse transcriptase domain-containing protein n=1 Tax=Oryzias melastigma TaxID=30732 RepID=A0A3B3DKH2_ORYME